MGVPLPPISNSTAAQFDGAELITTFRVDQQLQECPQNPGIAGQPTTFYMFTYHHRRLLEAATYLQWQKARLAVAEIEELHSIVKRNLSSERDEPLRVRVSDLVTYLNYRNTFERLVELVFDRYVWH